MMLEHLVKIDNPISAVVSDMSENQDLVANVNADSTVVSEVSENQDCDSSVLALK